ncbi:MAG: hypothetical protein M1815_001373 [Lichina confinis]|nr:MAG: hypothetical protein M1815_001373 [Lichina confinis]
MGLEFFDSWDSLRLDIVGFLAILGEGSVATNAQNCSASKFSFLPRLLPAPQAFMRPERPASLPTVPATIVGVWSGNVRQQVGYFADVLHDGQSLPRHTVRLVSVTKSRDAPRVRVRSGGPLTYLSLLGALMSLESIILSVHYDDGKALLATILLSLTSTLVGISSRWFLELPSRGSNRPTPPSDVVVVYPRGVFLVVRCNEDVARELYIAPETCSYQVSLTYYRGLSLMATLLLMFGVIMMGNATQNLQINFLAAYIILNSGYWIVAALPRRWHWDLSRYTVKQESYSMGEKPNSDSTKTGIADEQAGSFTEALWRAIALSRTSRWVRQAPIAPVSSAWDEWMGMAEEIVSIPEIEDGAVKGERRDGTRITRIPQWDWNQALTSALHPSSTSSAV